MQGLQQRRSERPISSVQPCVPLVRREDAATDRPTEHQQRTMRQPAPTRVECLAEPWPQRSNHQIASPWPVVRWAGQDRGIRRPDPFEVPLSWAEVMSPIREGAL